MVSKTLLEGVKAALGITGTYHDRSTEIYIEEVMRFISMATGYSDYEADSHIGLISRGVDDLRNGRELSEYFKMRVTQEAVHFKIAWSKYDTQTENYKPIGVTEDGELQP